MFLATGMRMGRLTRSMIPLMVAPLVPLDLQAAQHRSHRPSKKELVSNLEALKRESDELEEQHRYAEATETAEERLAIARDVYGPMDHKLAPCLTYLAWRYRFQSRYNEALPLYEEALTIVLAHYGSGHIRTAWHLSSLAVLCDLLGEYSRAEEHIKQAIAIREAHPESRLEDLTHNLCDLGLIYHHQTKYLEAGKAHERALAMLEETESDCTNCIARALLCLGELYRTLGNADAAEPLYKRAMKIDRTPPPESREKERYLSGLAAVYEHQGKLAEAERLYLRVLDYIQKDGFGSTDGGSQLKNLGRLYLAQGRYAEAEPLLAKGMAIWKKTLGPDHLYVGYSLSTFGELRRMQGRLEEAEDLFRRALVVIEKAVGSQHPNLEGTLTNLGELYRLQGRFSEALPLFQRALEVVTARLGDDHPSVPICLSNLAALYVELDDKSKALPTAIQAQELNTKLLAKLLSYAPEQQRLLYLQRVDPYSLFAALNHVPRLASAVLHFKGIVLDSLLEDHLLAEASSDPDHRAILKKLRTAKQLYTRTLLSLPADEGPDAQSRKTAELERLVDQVETLETALARYAGQARKDRWALRVTTADVKQALPKRGALIELLRYKKRIADQPWKPYYGAVLLTPDHDPVWVPLAEAQPIDAMIERYQSSLHTGKNEELLEPLLRNLYDHLWAPLQPHIPSDTREIFICPDGALNMLSFATLLTPDDRFLLQDYALRYVSTGRDLVRSIPSTPSRELVIFSDPVFLQSYAAKPKSLINPKSWFRELDTRDLQTINLQRLMGTEKESAFLERQAEAWGWTVKSYKRSQATETRLRSTHSPLILHLATHATYLRNQPKQPPASVAMPVIERNFGGLFPRGDPFQSKAISLENPMHRGFLALAGAQSTIMAWRQGEVPAMDSDGVMMAEEVAGLPLRGTWLVTLSGCETGIGANQSGEGVLGLRRGFAQAGVQHLLLTLWRISDEMAYRFMVDFYEALHLSDNPSDALTRVQRKWLVEQREKWSIRTAIRVAGPYIMSTQGRPAVKTSHSILSRRF